MSMTVGLPLLEKRGAVRWSCYASCMSSASNELLIPSKLMARRRSYVIEGTPVSVAQVTWHPTQIVTFVG